jgi:hypothetical protein
MPRSPRKGVEARKGNRLSVSSWNRLVGCVVQYFFVPPLYGQATSAGTMIRLDEIPDIWGRIVSGGTGGAYNMHQIVPDSAGAWSDRAFVFGALEINGFATITVGTRVECEYDRPSGLWLFRGSSC